MIVHPIVDPEFAPAPPKPGACIAGRCDGSGWIAVADAYVDRWAPWPKLSDFPNDEAYAKAIEAHRPVRAAFAKSSYPCPSCKPQEFHRWAGGHWDRNHNRDACDECRSVDRSTGRKVGPRTRETAPSRLVDDETEPLPPEPPEPPDDPRLHYGDS